MPAHRYIPHSSAPPADLKAAQHRIQTALVAGIQRVHRHPSSRPDVYLGAGGQIMADMLAFAALPHSEPVHRDAIATAALIAQPFSAPTPSHLSLLTSAVGPATLVLVRQLRLRQPPATPAHRHARRALPDLDAIELAETWRAAAGVLQDALEVCEEGEGEEGEDGGCEVLFGAAGLLYALLLLRAELAAATAHLAAVGREQDAVVKGIAGLCADARVREVVDAIGARGERGAEAYREVLGEREQEGAPPLMWRWRGTRYLGAAHGVAGILQMLARCPSKIVAPWWEKIVDTASWLLAQQDAAGNWPTRAPPSASYGDELVQWCHGAPGTLILFSTLLRKGAAPTSTCALPQEFVDRAIEALRRGGEVVYARGLLVKGVGLCHGVGGSVYALLALADVLDGEGGAGHWFGRAAHLADLATGYEGMTERGEMRVPERPYSLYEGVAGMCCAWATVLLRLSGESGRGGMAAYDDLAELESRE